MKSRFIPLVAMAVVTLALAAPAAALDEETFSPRQCANILSGGGQTFEDAASGSYDMTFALQADGRCGGMVFTLYIYDEDCTTVPAEPIAILTQRGTSASGSVAFAANDIDPDGYVYVYATSSFGGTVYDRAPDSGCIDVTPFSPGGGKFN